MYYYFDDSYYYFSNTLKKGNRNNSVKLLQDKLIRIGFYLGKNGNDGFFGTITENTIKSIQHAFNLTIDGIYDEITHEQLNTLIRYVGTHDYFYSNTAHFSQSQFLCDCCNKSTGIHLNLLLRLELLSFLSGEKIEIAEGFKCDNKCKNTNEIDYHNRGKACHIKAYNLDYIYYLCLKYCYNGGLKLHKDYIHIDTRGFKHRF